MADLDAGLREMRRVTRGPVAILTFDGDVLAQFWLGEYAPEVIGLERHRYPSVEHGCDELGGRTRVERVPLPIDCSDGWGEAFYARPQRFLDDAVRQAQSAWGLVDDAVQLRSVERLRTALRRRRVGPPLRSPA